VVNKRDIYIIHLESNAFLAGQPRMFLHRLDVLHEVLASLLVTTTSSPHAFLEVVFLSTTL